MPTETKKSKMQIGIPRAMSYFNYIETYGCQMNVNDSEVILSILQDAGYALTESIEDADVILANTCSIRDNAEQRIYNSSCGTNL